MTACTPGNGARLDAAEGPVAQALARPARGVTRRRCAASAAWIFAVPLIVALAGCAGPAVSVAQSAAPVSDAGATVTIALTDFAFTPDHIVLRVGVPVRLRLVNQSKGGHDFSAPGFFAASDFPPGATAPAGGKVEVDAQQTVEFALTPRMPGSYPVECTHFLHSLFGMTATIAVVS